MGTNKKDIEELAEVLTLFFQLQQQQQKQFQQQFQDNEQDQETDQTTKIDVNNGSIVLSGSGNSAAHTENESVVRAVFDQLLRNQNQAQSDSAADSTSAADSGSNATSDSSTDISMDLTIDV